MSDPKLLSARERITDILDALDIGAVVVLHNKPGSVEVFFKLDPSYSAVSGAPPEFRLKSKRADYNGDTEAQTRDQAATASMVSSFAEVLGATSLWLMELSNVIDTELGAVHTPLTPDR